MSSDDGDGRGWFDGAQPFEWDSREHGGTTDWESLENHGLNGSHWGWELGENWREKDDEANIGDRFQSLADANMVARELALDSDNWLPRISEDTNAWTGAIGHVEVRWDENEMAWYIWVDAYVEY